MGLIEYLIYGAVAILALYVAKKAYHSSIKKPYLWNSGSGETHVHTKCRLLANVNWNNIEFISKRRFKYLHKKGLANGCANCFPGADDDSTNLSTRLMNYFRKL